MDGLTLKTARVIGTPSQDVWAQVYTVDGFFLILVLQKQGDDTNLPALGKEIFLRIEEKYQKEQQKNLAFLRTLLTEETHSTGSGQASTVSINTLAAGMVAGNILYLAGKNASAYLKRAGRLEPVLTAPEADVAASSGFLEDGDFIYLIGRELAVILEGEKKDEYFSFGDPQEAAEAITTAIHQAENEAKLVAFLAKAKKLFLMAPQEEPLLPSPSPLLAKPPLSHRLLLSLTNVVQKVGRGKSKRVIITVFLLLVVLFITSLVLGIGKKEQEKREARFNQVQKLAEAKYQEGKELTDLNPALSVKTLREAQEAVKNELANLEEKSPNREKLLALLSKIEEGLQTSLHISTLSEVPVFFDLTLIKDAALGDSMSLFEQNVVVLDKKNNSLYRITIDKKQSELLGALFSGPVHEAVGALSAFVVDDNGINRILLASPPGGEVNKKKETVLEKDNDWGQMGAISYFAGNLYILDKSKAGIYKYQGISDGFTSKKNYLGPGVEPDFNNAVSMAIDGAVWVLFSDGRINRFLQGAPQAFSIAGLDMPLVTPKTLFTNDENKNLYLLDSGNSRVVVISKEGNYLSQYKWEGIKDATDMVVSEKEGKILLLTESKIYGIEIK